MTTLLTGWSGFVGSAVHERLVSPVLLSRSTRGEANAIACDLTDASAMSRLDLSEITGVIHCASAIPSSDLDDYELHNVLGTQNLLDALDPARVGHVTLVSSVSVYRSGPKIGAALEEYGYGGSKMRQEQLVREWTAINDIGVTVFRPSSIYGVGMRTSTVLPVFVRRARHGEPLIIRAPDYVQNLVWVQDVADIVVMGHKGRVEGTFNLFSPETLSLVELARLVVEVLGSSSEIRVEPDGFTRSPVVFDRSELLRVFDHSFVPLGSGIQKLVQDD